MSAYSDNTGERHGRAVDAGHEKATEDDFVESGVGTALKMGTKLDTCSESWYVFMFEELTLTGQEAVELHEKLEVDIVALGRFAVRAPNVMGVKIDTYSELASCNNSFMISSRCSSRLN